MVLLSLSVDAKAVPLATLARYIPHAPAMRAALNQSIELCGSVVLVTCNRVELYAEAVDPHAGERALRRAFALAPADPTLGPLGQDNNSAVPAITLRQDEQVVRHLCRVASGLESLLVGDSDIAGQVRRAFAEAQLSGTSSSGLYALFTTAARTAKQIARESALGAATRTLVSHAWSRLQNTGSMPPHPHVLLVGSGSYARVVLGMLHDHAVASIGVYSRGGYAARLPERYACQVITDQQLPDALHRANVIIGASGAGDYAITRSQLAAARDKGSAPLWLLDLALPADLDPAASGVPGVYRWDLSQFSAEAPPESEASLAQAHGRIEAAVAQWRTQVHRRALAAELRALEAVFSIALHQELERCRPGISEAELRRLELSMRRMSQSILHHPRQRATQSAQHNELERYRDALSCLFGIGAPPNA